MRDEALERVLVDRQQDAKRGATAFDVRYDAHRRGKKRVDRDAPGTRAPVMLQMTEQSELSTRKYMFHVTDRLSIGSRQGENDLVVSGPNVAEHQCNIVRVGKEIYINNQGEIGQVLLRRGRKQMLLERNAVELRDGDVLELGGFTYRIDILRE